MGLDYKKKIIGLSVLTGLSFWLIDTIMDCYSEGNTKTFFESLFTDDPIHEFYVRIFVFVALIAFGIIVSKYVGQIEAMEQRYSKLFGSINDAIFILVRTQTNQYKINAVNQYVSSMLGYQQEELLQLSFSDLMSPKIALENPSLADIIRENKHVVFEADLKRKDGDNLMAEISVYPCDVSMTPGVLLIARDITIRKRNEQVLLESEKQLQIMASQLLNAQEAERQRISVGLHDELGQALMHLKFKVGSFLKEYQNNSPRSTGADDGLLSYVDEIIEYVRRLSRELSPSVLEEIGLTSSIHYLVEEFCDHYQLNCNSIEVDQIDQFFPFETQLNIFRIFQECLTNVSRHAQATGVSVAAKNRGDHVFFLVEDDGKGIDFKNEDLLSGPQRGIGISAMHQRARMTAGALEVRSTKGTGTRVSFTIPIVNS